jgi:hypothetical protein
VTGGVRSQKSEVGGRRSEVGGRRSEVGGRRSEVGGRKSKSVKIPQNFLFMFVIDDDGTKDFISGYFPELEP